MKPTIRHKIYSKTKQSDNNNNNENKKQIWMIVNTAKTTNMHLFGIMSGLNALLVSLVYQVINNITDNVQYTS